MRLLRREEGFTGVTFLLMMVVLILAVGAVSVDLWHVVSEHRELAGQVDGAVLSAANALDTDALRSDPPAVALRPDEAVARACAYLRASGTTSVCPGPQAQIVVGVDSVTVTVRRDVQLTLLNLLSGLDPAADTSPIDVVATATARATTR